MSRIADLGNKLENVVNVLIEYDDQLMGYEDNLRVKGKTLEYALKEQASWYAYYNQRRIELKTIISFLELKLKKIRGEFYVQYNENYNPKLGDRAIDRYIDREPEVEKMNLFLLEAHEILERYDMILDAFNRRGFVLRDVTASRVNEVYDSSL